MSLINAKKQIATVVNVDSLLQDSYLLVVELRQRGVMQNSEELSTLCSRQIEFVRQQLEKAGLSARNIDYISHAQCALLDETALTFAQGDAHVKWARETLQTKFFNRHQAGEFLYEDIREVLREPAPDQSVLTAFQRVLLLGFRGRYHEENDAERAHVVAALNAHVAPLELSHSIPTQLNRGPRGGLGRWIQMPWIHALAVGGLLVGAWLGLDQLLARLVASLLPGQA